MRLGSATSAPLGAPLVRIGFVVPPPDRITRGRTFCEIITGDGDARCEFSAARTTLSECGSRVTAVVEQIVLYEHPIQQSELPLLRQGLSALDQHFIEN
jgi:hypothetical protein